MTRTDTQIIAAETRTEWQAYEDIARMLEADGVTADDVLGLEAAIRYNKAALWARSRDEWTNAYDNSMETLGLNAFAAAHIAEIMEEFEECPGTALQAEIDDAKREEDEEYHMALAAEPDLDAIKDTCPDFAYCGTDAPEVIAIQEKLRAADDHAAVDDSWMDRRCYTTIRAKDGGSGQRVDVDPPTWRDKIELEHQLREDGYEFVDVTTDGGRLVIVWYRPQMPRPMVDRIIKEIEEA